MIATQQAGAIFERVFVSLLVLVTKTVAPIAAVVATKVGGKVDAECEGAGRGDRAAQREAGCYDVVWHGVGVG